MGQNKFRKINICITLGLFFYYLGCIYFFKPYLNYIRGLFISEKLQMLLTNTHYYNRLDILTTTTPQTALWCSIPFALINRVWAPFMASAAEISYLYFMLVKHIKRFDGKWAGVLLTFMCHPFLIYVAINGSEDALILVFLNMLFFYLSKYFKHYLSYYLLLVSFILSALVFTDFRFIYLCTVLIPSLLLTSYNITMKEISAAPSGNTKMSLWLQKDFSLLMVIYFFPIVFGLSYLLYNRLSFDDYFYFLNSPYRNLYVIFNNLGRFYKGSSPLLKTEYPQFYKILAGFLTATPVVILSSFIYKNLKRIWIILTGILLYSAYIYLFTTNGFEYYVRYWTIFLMAGMFLIQKRQSIVRLSRIYVLYFIAIFTQIAVGWGLIKTNQTFLTFKGFTIMHHRIWGGSLNTTDREMAQAIRKVPPGRLILADDATTFSVIALTDDIHRFLLPSQNHIFISALAKPGEQKVSYMLIDKLNGANILYIKRFNERFSNNQFRTVYENDAYKLISIR